MRHFLGPPAAAFLLFLVSSSVFAGNPGFTPIDDGRLEQLISFEADRDIFPDAWTEDSIQSDVKPISEEQKDRARSLVRKAVRRYPAELIERSLDRIYLIGELQFYGKQNFSGTAHHRAVYLVVKPGEDGYSDQFIRRNFHREFSTTLLNRHLDQFEKKKWKGVNGSDFSYMGGNSWNEYDSGNQKEAEGGAQAISSGRISLELTEDKSFLQRGLLTEYSASSVENDFNEYAARLFTGDRKFWRSVTSYGGVKKKCALAMQFYRSVHPGLTPDYFRSLVE